MGGNYPPLTTGFVGGKADAANAGLPYVGPGSSNSSPHPNTCNATTQTKPSPTMSESALLERIGIKGQPAEITLKTLTDDTGDQQLQTWPHLTGALLSVVPMTTSSMLMGCDVPIAHLVLDQRFGQGVDAYAVLGPPGQMLGPTQIQGRKGTPKALSYHLSSGALSRLN
ncbi:hypothetical protein P879_05465 [Paragonimus westermani]|uniref:Uncharacterized protein n=1 Tax=Paragonimus westermani TaxID=34504 RepID=A0A8T0DM67_9TREM|nr:hypothetical protein P879_05465 [Paragonimus westermani]